MFNPAAHCVYTISTVWIFVIILIFVPQLMKFPQSIPETSCSPERDRNNAVVTMTSGKQISTAHPRVQVNVGAKFEESSS